MCMGINKFRQIGKKNHTAAVDKNRVAARKIKIALINVDVKQVDIARTCGCNRSAVTQVINGGFRSKRIEAAITSFTGLDLDRLLAKNKRKTA